MDALQSILLRRTVERMDGGLRKAFDKLIAIARSLVARIAVLQE